MTNEELVRRYAAANMTGDFDVLDSLRRRGAQWVERLNSD